MKKLLLIGSLIVVMGALFIIFGMPALAQRSDNVTPPNQQAWQDMYQACRNGDWSAMADAAQRAHGDNWNGMMGGWSNPSGGNSGTGSGWGGMMGGGWGSPAPSSRGYSGNGWGSMMGGGWSSPAPSSPRYSGNGWGGMMGGGGGMMGGW